MNLSESKDMQVLLRYLCGVRLDGEDAVTQGQAVEAAKKLARASFKFSFRAVTPEIVWERFGQRGIKPARNTEIEQPPEPQRPVKK